jgi:CRISPR/Cas system CSM-associated protein Csm2 small subunit
LWNDRIVKTRIKINRGRLTILVVYAPTGGREDLNEEFYETLQKILDKVNNKNDYMSLIRDRN